MSDLPRSGRTSTQLGGRTYWAQWQVVGDRVEVSCEFGFDSAPLGQLRAAPGTVAREKLAEMVKRAGAGQSRPATAGTRRPSIRDMMLWRP